MEPSSVKSEQRLRYESEITRIRRRYGDLEDMRRALGFSQRKMAELLLVDPSAWSRWTKDGGEAPPHVYRALAWYMELHPPGAAMPMVSPVVEKVNFSADRGEVPGEWHEQFDNLKAKYEKDLAVSMGWKLFLMLNTAAVIYLIFSRFL